MTTLEKRQPWFKFYPDNWRADADLVRCSMAARGLWIEMLVYMAGAPRVGEMVDREVKPMDITAIAQTCRCDPKTTSKLVEELRKNGVFSVNSEGAIYSRKMVADFEKSKKHQEAGKRGGNPSLKTGLKPEDKHRSKKPEARSQSIALRDGEEAPPITLPETAPEAVKIIAAFDDELVNAYGEGCRRPWAAANDRVHADRLVWAGWTEATARGVFRAALSQRAAGGAAQPGGLAWFERRFAGLIPENAPKVGAAPSRNDPVEAELTRLIDEHVAKPNAERGPMPTRADAERTLAERKGRAA